MFFAKIGPNLAKNINSSGQRSVSTYLNTSRPRQNGRHFAEDISKRIFFNENVWISIKFSLKFVPRGPININPEMFRIMAWRRPGDRPLSEAMLVSLLTHICVTRPQWVKHVFSSFEYKTIDVGIVKRRSTWSKNFLIKIAVDMTQSPLTSLERIADIIAEPLKLIINQSLCTEIFPHRLKLALAKIVPLFKNSDPHILDNNHPISILSAFSKVPEKVVFHQTYAFLTGNKLLYSD